ncbi:PQQ-dependent sugar dehydrogenase [Haliscomenobacter sp.]|uniref:PQQ-dependent sugar dehydrogenase n=1 Tax=Haliscomenobacter sp. TaxID=2717303 RepID=UPI003594604D
MKKNLHLASLGYHLSKNFWFILFCTISTSTFAQPNIALSPVLTTGLSAPMQLVNAGDGSKRIFIVQKAGSIRVYDSAFQFLATLVTVPNITSSGERGLLSMAFHPSYKNNGFFYVYYTNASGDLEVSRYRISANDANVADPNSKVVLITIPHPNFSNHNGGELHFGNDGFLYLSTGDGGSGGDPNGNAQRTTSLLGKILRFNVNTSLTTPYYTVPAGNPFGNEVFALGLRNPYRWSFDRQTGDMWIGDVGQDSFEEINFRAANALTGTNYGWRCYEGDAMYNTNGCAAKSSYVFPAHAYVSQNPAASITGGVVYRGTDYPALQGCYVAADFYSGIFYKIVPNGASAWTVSTQTFSLTGVVDFGETEDGEVFVVSNTRNSVSRLTSVGTTSSKNPQEGKALASIYPSLVSDGFVKVEMYAPTFYQYFELVDMNGRRLLKTDLSKQIGTRTIPLNPNLATGMYVAKVSSNLGVTVQKIYIQ